MDENNINPLPENTDGLGFWTKVAIGAGIAVTAGAVGYATYSCVKARSEIEDARKSFDNAMAAHAKNSEEMFKMMKDIHNLALSIDAGSSNMADANNSDIKQKPIK